MLELALGHLFNFLSRECSITILFVKFRFEIDTKRGRWVAQILWGAYLKKGANWSIYGTSVIKSKSFFCCSVKGVSIDSVIPKRNGWIK